MIRCINRILEGREWSRIFKEYQIRYGTNRQLTILAEECVELSKEVLKMKRYIESGEEIPVEQYIKFTNEYVDLMIMLKQFEHVPSIINTTNALDAQLIRANERLNDS